MSLARRRANVRAKPLDADLVARVAFGLLCLAVAIGIFVYPTYPNYDSYYSLLWGREVLDLQLPGFEGFRVPTEHPLAIAVGALLSLFGDAGDRLWIAATFATYLWLVWGVYRLGRIAFTPLIGGVAALLLLTRFDFAFLAARGYIDVPYMALVVWAAVLEAQRPRRGAPVLILLALAGLLRPEAWVLAAAYWLWLAWRASWRDRIIYAALAAIGPLVWATVDFIVTGDPLFSLLYTSGSAEDLGRQRPLSELPVAVPEFLANIVKLPVLVAAVLGLAFALLAAPRRMVMPFVLLVVRHRHVRADRDRRRVGDRALPRGRGRRPAAVRRGRPRRLHDAEQGPPCARRGWSPRSRWSSFGVAYTATQVRLDYFDNELTFRGDAHDDLVRVLESDGVRRGLECGPLTLPNHKLVPDARWIADLPADRVIPRADRSERRPRRGVALIVTSRFAIFKHAWTSESDSPLVQMPPPGFRPVTTGELLQRLCALLSCARARRARAGGGTPGRSRSPRSCSAPRCCASGAPATACRTSTTPTRTRTSWRGRSACSATR